jgi:hypothetical protein
MERVAVVDLLIVEVAEEDFDAYKEGEGAAVAVIVLLALTEDVAVLERVVVRDCVEEALIVFV